jgi:hypothetical protein
MRTWHTVRVAAVLLAVVVASSAASAFAQFTIDDTFVPLSGDVIATHDEPLALTYSGGLPDGATVDEDNVFNVMFHERVYRDPLTQRLTFLYQVDQPDSFRSLTGDPGNIVISSFGGFDINITATGFWFGDISEDGNTITAETTGVSSDAPLSFAIATDATDFDTGGNLEWFFSNVFAITVPDEPLQDQANLTAHVTLSGTFQPATDDGGGGGGGTAIPLPHAAWGGLLALVVAGATARRNARRICRLA